ncbi:hypothetical protein C0J52_07798 [Blattella germanica]|nr:hypothetical protein C0J52_07798 [Blattella germanica]
MPSYSLFATVYQWASETGTFTPSRADCGAPRRRRTPEFEEDVLNLVEEDATASTRKIAGRLNVDHKAICRVLHEQQLHPYHPQRVQAMQKEDFGPRANFCRWFLHHCVDEPDFHNGSFSLMKPTSPEKKFLTLSFTVSSTEGSNFNVVSMATDRQVRVAVIIEPGPVSSVEDTVTQSKYLNEGNDSELSELDELEEDYQHEDNVVTDNLSHEANETPGLQLDVLHEEETLPSEEAAVENQHIVMSCARAAEASQEYFVNQNLTDKKNVQCVNGIYVSEQLEFFESNSESDVVSLPSPLELFCKYISDELLDKVVEQTNLYALQDNVPNFSPTNVEELKTFFGIHLVMDSQGQENKDVRKSVGSLLMSSMEVSRLEQRAYIKIAVLRGQNARECHAQLLEAVGARALPYRTVARWVAAFESGREATKDKPRTGRPRTVRTEVSREIQEFSIILGGTFSGEVEPKHYKISYRYVYKIQQTGRDNEN